LAAVDEGDRFPEPGTLFFGEVGEKGEEVALVAAAQGRPQIIAPRRGIGLVEEDDFRADCGQAPQADCRVHRRSGRLMWGPRLKIQSLPQRSLS
jgi:hypothetical protein